MNMVIIVIIVNQVKINIEAAVLTHFHSLVLSILSLEFLEFPTNSSASRLPSGPIPPTAARPARENDHPADP